MFQPGINKDLCPVIGKKNNSAPYGYQSIDQQHEFYIRIDDIDLGSFAASDKANLKICIGPRKLFQNFSSEFHRFEIPQRTWAFQYKNADRASFVIALFKKRVFGRDSEIGEVELKLNAFQPNAVTQRTFTLHSPNSNAIPAKIVISVHANENGSGKFHAQKATAFNENNFEIHHKKTYLPK